MAEDEPTEEEVTQAINAASAQAALEAAAAPVFTNRFEILPSAVEGHVTVVFGGGAFGGVAGGEQRAVAKMHAACLMPYHVARQLVAHLTHRLEQADAAQKTEPEDASGE